MSFEEWFKNYQQRIKHHKGSKPYDWFWECWQAAQKEKEIELGKLMSIVAGKIGAIVAGVGIKSVNEVIAKQNEFKKEGRKELAKEVLEEIKDSQKNEIEIDHEDFMDWLEKEAKG